MNLHANATTCPNSRELLARRVIELDTHDGPYAPESTRPALNAGRVGGLRTAPWWARVAAQPSRP
jgi:hypothetical protein